VLAVYQEAFDDYPKNVCCSCQQLHPKQLFTVVMFEYNLGTAVLPLLKEYIVKQNPSAADEMHYICNYCLVEPECQTPQKLTRKI